MKANNAFAERIRSFSQAEQKIVDSFPENARPIVESLLVLELNESSMRELNITTATDLCILKMIQLLCVAVRGRKIHSKHLKDFGVDATLPCWTLEAMRYAISEYKWDEKLVKKLVGMTQDQIDTVLGIYIIAQSCAGPDWYCDNVLDKSLTKEEMIDRVNKLYCA
jgi:hypothetical protein